MSQSISRQLGRWAAGEKQATGVAGGGIVLPDVSNAFTQSAAGYGLGEAPEPSAAGADALTKYWPLWRALGLAAAGGGLGTLLSRPGQRTRGAIVGGMTGLSGGAGFNVAERFGKSPLVAQVVAEHPVAGSALQALPVPLGVGYGWHVGGRLADALGYPYVPAEAQEEQELAANA